MKKTIWVLILFLNFYLKTEAQYIKGNLKQQAGQEIQLIGFNNFKSELLDNTTIDKEGNFSLIPPIYYKGVCVLVAQDKTTLIVIRTQPTIELNAIDMAQTANVNFVNSEENQMFRVYVKNHVQKTEALNAWQYLSSLYSSGDFTKHQKKDLKKIKRHLQNLRKEDAGELNKIDNGLYIKWYIPNRQFISDMQIAYQENNQGNIDDLIQKISTIDFSDSNFKQSGMLEDIIKWHFLLFDKLKGQSLENFENRMKRSVDYMLENTMKDEILYNDFGDHLFKLFEEKGFVKVSEYLALNMLSQNSCALQNNLSKKLESYRKLAIGKQAPNIDFKNDSIPDLYIYQNQFKLVVFGSSWCPHCVEEIPKLANYYNKWKKENNLEIFFISLDTNLTDYNHFIKDFRWINYCDLKGWDSEPVNNYAVYGTPTFYLLDNDNGIVLKPVKISEIEDYFEKK